MFESPFIYQWVILYMPFQISNHFAKSTQWYIYLYIEIDRQRERITKSKHIYIERDRERERTTIWHTGEVCVSGGQSAFVPSMWFWTASALSQSHLQQRLAVYMCIHETHWERERGRGRERDRMRERQAGQQIGRQRLTLTQCLLWMPEALHRRGRERDRDRQTDWEREREKETHTEKEPRHPKLITYTLKVANELVSKLILTSCELLRITTGQPNSVIYKQTYASKTFSSYIYTLSQLSP